MAQVLDTVCGAGHPCPSPSNWPTPGARPRAICRGRAARRFAPTSPDGWQTVAPSYLPMNPTENPPMALSRDDLAKIRETFVTAAKRAARLGIDAVQLHGAHGYLMHQFLSPLSNLRDDEYGGSLENRMRFPLEVFDAVRAAFPADRPVTMRVSGTDWIDGGWTIEETVAFAQALESAAAPAIHVSSGGLAAAAKIPVGPGYQVALARRVKDAVSIPVIAVGLITEFEQAEAILAAGDADLIALARAMLYNPHWPWHAAAHFGAHVRAHWTTGYHVAVDRWDWRAQPTVSSTPCLSCMAPPGNPCASGSIRAG